jgi:hypothetical protein
VEVRTSPLAIESFRASLIVADSCYAALAELLLTYKVPALSFIPETKSDVHIRDGYAMLSTWVHIPFMRRGLGRIRCMMLKAGISLDSEVPGDVNDYSASSCSDPVENIQN